ncbi:MAG: hypothetical protein KQJ78_23610 [Deltaproteobacteria bacterium]|nr:hypothetical protein [Deltaproteobacteria bacterium]
MRGANWKTYTGLGVIFLAGVLVGMLATGMYVRHQVKVRANALIQGDREAATDMAMGQLTRALDLTPAQEKALRPLVAQGADDLRTLRARLRPQFRAVFSRTAGRMLPLLTPAQQAKLQSILARVDRGLTAPPPTPPASPSPAAAPVPAAPTPAS